MQNKLKNADGAGRRPRPSPSSRRFGLVPRQPGSTLQPSARTRTMRLCTQGLPRRELNPIQAARRGAAWLHGVRSSMDDGSMAGRPGRRGPPGSSPSSLPSKSNYSKFD
jgi:hypothetical protein